MINKPTPLAVFHSKGVIDQIQGERIEKMQMTNEVV